jgi:predicted histone-like DNA-binding protein
VEQHRGTVQLVIAGLVDVLVNNLDDGKSVKLGEFGTFRLSINAKCSEMEEEASAGKIYHHKIVFTPENALKAAMNRTTVTRYSRPDTDYTVKGREGSNNNSEDDDTT